LAAAGDASLASQPWQKRFLLRVFSKMYHAVNRHSCHAHATREEARVPSRAGAFQDLYNF
jgi:hypothetical protein